MIEVVGASALADTLGGITTGMAGQGLADAWQSQGFDDPESHMVDYTTGSIESTTYRAKSIIEGNDKPAISGDASGSVSTSTEADPIDAFETWSEENPGSVDQTTGGLSIGSKVQTYAYSLFRTLDPDTQLEVIKAVVPVAVPAKQAYVAISQALGVSMDVAQQSVEVQTAMEQSQAEFEYRLLNETIQVASDFVACWWDGVNILFPRKAVQSVSDKLDELNIGRQPDINEETASGTCNAGVVSAGYSDGTFSFISVDGTVYFTAILGYGYYASTGPFTITMYSYGPIATVTGLYSSDYNLYVADHGVLGGGWTNYGSTCSVTDFWLSVGGTPIRTLPSGTAVSEAPYYTPSSIPSAGGVAKSATDTEDVVAIKLYDDDPYNTIGRTADPNAPTSTDVVGSLPKSPPLELPIPAVVPSDPSISLDDSSVIDSTRVKAATDALADSLRANPPKSIGIIDFPDLPNIGGSFPSIIPSSGPGLIHVYNPTPAEFIAFGRWLWVTYADASIDKIWNNPFDGIIGAFELYATPATNGTDNIYSGFLTCPTVSKIVPQRYTEIDCGTVIVPEFYGNYFDYSPYSQCYIYLPFIGINEVSIDDIVGHAVNIRYRIDAYNGSCIAMIYVAKDGYRNLCYQFAGNCAVEVPLAGGSQAAIKAGVLQAEAYARASQMSSVISGIASTMMGGATGGLAGALMGFAGGITSGASAYQNAKAGLEAARVANKSSVQHSGQFGASHGAMGVKKPFIIIRNPIQVKVVNYNEEYGFPAHKRVIIGACRGYLQVREVNVISAHATDAEKSAIENMLKAGVYVS